MSSGKRSRSRKRKTPRTKTNSKRTRKSRADLPAVARTRSTEQASARSRLAYLSLGSNVGNRRDHLTRALAEISRRARVVVASSFYSTGPVGHAKQRRFWNAVVAIRWTGSPASLLAAVKEVERRGGRVPTFRNGPREIDVDILDLRGLVRAGRDPILPHPRMARRRFVLAPLEEIAPGWKHPVTGLTARQMLAELPARPSVRKIARTAARSIARTASHSS